MGRAHTADVSPSSTPSEAGGLGALEGPGSKTNPSHHETKTSIQGEILMSSSVMLNGSGGGGGGASI